MNCNGFVRWTLTQAGILTGLKHGHVVEMRGFYKWDTAYCLALEHMAGGELCDDIIRRVNYSEADARNVSSPPHRGTLLLCAAVLSDVFYYRLEFDTLLKLLELW